MKKTLTIIVALMIAAPAMASISISWTRTPNAATTTLGAALDKYVLTATASSGVINAVEAGKPGTYGTTEISTNGFTGGFYQVAPYDPGTFGYPPTPVANGAPEVDTHWLFTPSSIVYAAEEDNPRNIVAPSEGWGTYLVGTFGVLATEQAGVLEIAQFYVAAGQTFDYDFKLSESGVGNEQFTGTVPIPEPATMSLLGVGALALLRRRK